MPNSSITRKPSRAKLKKLITSQKSITGSFSPTMSDVVYWYDYLNVLLFKNELPELNQIEIRDFRDFWAEAYCEQDGEKVKNSLRIEKDFNTFKQFLEVLAHEMVHIWEFKNFGRMGHAKRFKSWEAKFKPVGLDLFVTL